jgi:hypothetical protein
MASRSVRTKKAHIQVKLADGSFFACPCGATSFRITEDDAELHLFCRCGEIYVTKDLPPLWEDE